MKKIIIILIILISPLFFIKFENNQETLNVANWGEYIDDEVISQFEELYNVKVNYELYDSNESLYTKMKKNTANYDVVFPSEYMVDKLISEDLIQKVDFSKIENVKYIDNNLIYNEYCLPYFWGTVGILYNKEMTNLDFDTWQDLWDESLKNNIIIVDSAREMLGIALDTLGYSLNSTNENELLLAQEKLMQLTPNVKAILLDEILQLMPNNEAAVAITWSGAAQDMMSKNENLEYVIPNEGTNIWIDSVVIPKNAENVELAHKFINFLMDPEISYQNSSYVGYSTPNIIAKEILKENDEYNAKFYPDENEIKKYEMYKNLSPEMTLLYNDLFLEFKMN